MGKKRTRAHNTSKGERPNVKSSTLQAVARSVTTAVRAIQKLDAWKAGKNPWISIPGSKPNDPHVRYKANDLYGDPRHAKSNLFKMRGEE